MIKKLIPIIMVIVGFGSFFVIMHTTLIYEHDIPGITSFLVLICGILSIFVIAWITASAINLINKKFTWELSPWRRL